MEGLFLLDPGDTLGRCLEVEPQGTFDGDFAETEVARREDPADDDLFFLAVLGDDSRVTITKVGKNLQDVLGALERDLAALITQALAHRYPE